MISKNFINLLKRSFNFFPKRNTGALLFSIVFLFSLWALPLRFFTNPTNDNSWIKISGTSTLHDWEMSSNTFNYDAKFIKNEKGIPTALKSLDFTLVAVTLKSTNKTLDKNAYKALNVKIYPKIHFKSVSSDITQMSGQKIMVTIKGKLTVSGKTKDKEIKAVCEVTSNNQMVCTGETAFKMTEFEVKPPTFMLGAMKTGDKVSIYYKINFKI